MNNNKEAEEARNIMLQMIKDEDGFLSDNIVKAHKMAIKALEQEPCEDVIGRSDMLDAIGHGTTYTSEELQKIIKALPSVNPQPKMDLSELKRRILMEVDGGTDDRMLRYCDVCDRISDSIDKYQAESEEI